MNRGSIEFMLKTATKKPRLQKLIDDLENISADEIEKNTEQPLWIRKNLIKMKSEAEVKNRMTTLNIPQAAPNVRHLLPVHKYNANECYWLKNNGKLGIDVEPYDVILFVEDEAVKVNSTVLSVSAEEYEYLKNNSDFIDNMTITAYNEFLQIALLEKYGDTPAINDSVEHTPSFMDSVRIG